MQSALAATRELAAHTELRPCIVDPRLVTSEWGAAIISKIGSRLELWISQFAREILRSPGDHADADSLSALVPRTFPWSARPSEPAREKRVVQEQLEVWRCAPKMSDVARVRLHFVGDRPDESCLPTLSAVELHERFQYFHQPLFERGDRIDQPSNPQPEYLQPGRGRQLAVVRTPNRASARSTLAECFIETTALAAALFSRNPFILSRLEGDSGGAPALCEYLGHWKLNVRAVPNRGGRFARPLRDSLSHCGLESAVWSGLRLAVVYVAFARPLLDRTSRLTAVEAGNAPPLLAEDPWSSARIFWHEI